MNPFKLIAKLKNKIFSSRDELCELNQEEASIQNQDCIKKSIESSEGEVNKNVFDESYDDFGWWSA